MMILSKARLSTLAAVALIGATALLGLLRGSAVRAQAPLDRLNAPAPELVGGPWLNVPGNRPIQLAEQRGKVVVLHFWTFG